MKKDRSGGSPALERRGPGRRRRRGHEGRRQGVGEGPRDDDEVRVLAVRDESGVAIVVGRREGVLARREEREREETEEGKEAAGAHRGSEDTGGGGGRQVRRALWSARTWVRLQLPVAALGEPSHSTAALSCPWSIPRRV